MKHNTLTSPAVLGGGAAVSVYGRTLWTVLAAFAILAALTAVARIVPRRGALPLHASRPGGPSRSRTRGAHAGPGRFARMWSHGSRAA